MCRTKCWLHASSTASATSEAADPDEHDHEAALQHFCRSVEGFSSLAAGGHETERAEQLARARQCMAVELIAAGALEEAKQALNQAEAHWLAKPTLSRHDRSRLGTLHSAR